MNKEYVIDARDAENVSGQIKALASSYTPEWSFNPDDPDIGAVIALVFARQTEETVKRLNLTLSKYRTEFVNMLDLPLLPAHPARGVVIVRLSGTVSGIDLPKGTRFIGTAEQEPTPLVFETVGDVHITNSSLTDIMAVFPSAGRIIPLLSGARRAALFEGEYTPEEVIGDEAESFPVFSLFGLDGEGIGRNALCIYHRNLFDVAPNVSITFRVTESQTGASLSGRLTDAGQYRWSYLSEEGLKPFDAVYERDGLIVLERAGGQTKTTLDGEAYSVVTLEALRPVTVPVEIGSISLSSSCDDALPDFVTHNATELDVQRFMPFGSTASIFDECYIGQDTVFSQPGVMVSMRFNLEYKQKLVTFTPEQESESLKVIKRKPRALQFNIAETEVQRVGFEYFNGTGWRILPCEGDPSTLFSGKTAGEVTLSFICPEDWKPLSIGGHTGRCFRMRVAQSDNCYLQPCMHKMPEISGFKLSYYYPEPRRQPNRVRRIQGATSADLTREVQEGRPFTAFAPLPYAHDALYLGFDKKMEGSPVSLLFEIAPFRRTGSSAIGFEYSTLSGFKPLKVVDNTENLTSLGTVLFVPPSDFAEREIEGVKRFWIRICDLDSVFREEGRPRPVIKSIMINAAEILNVETKPEESFYIDATRPNMSFQLAAQNILSADVFVNEKGIHSAAEMRRLAEERPEDVQITTNYLGNITEFFVRWQEVDDFRDSKPGDRHYRIDRMKNTIHFGDGLNVMMPRAQSGESFTVTARCTRGAAGNLPAGAIHSPQGRVLHIDDIYNPVDTWAGSDIENVDKAHERGANVLSSLGRTISVTDFLREVQGYSASVAKTRVVIGRDIDGRRDDGLITVAVMTNDYQNGAYSFNELKDGIKRLLLRKSEAALNDERLVVAEPIYVTVSVAVFAETFEPRTSFEIQNTVKTAINEFIDPLTSKERWEIGVLPDEEQIRLLLNSVRCPGTIRGYTITASYTDKRGVHECRLCDLKENSAFMIAVNGTHTVHVAQA